MEDDIIYTVSYSNGVYWLHKHFDAADDARAYAEAAAARNEGNPLFAIVVGSSHAIDGAVCFRKRECPLHPIGRPWRQPAQAGEPPIPTWDAAMRCRSNSGSHSRNHAVGSSPSGSCPAHCPPAFGSSLPQGAPHLHGKERDWEYERWKCREEEAQSRILRTRAREARATQGGR